MSNQLIITSPAAVSSDDTAKKTGYGENEWKLLSSCFA